MVVANIPNRFDLVFENVAGDVGDSVKTAPMLEKPAKGVSQVTSAVSGVKARVEKKVGQVVDRFGLMHAASGESTDSVCCYSLWCLGKKVHGVAMKAMKLMSTVTVSSMDQASKVSDLKLMDIAAYGLAVVSLPGKVSDLACSIFDTVFATRPKDRIVAILEGIEAATGIGSFTINTLGLLAELGKLTAESIAWTGIVSPILSILGVTGVAINAIGLDEARRFRNKLEKSLNTLPKRINAEGREEYDPEALKEAFELLLSKEASFLKRQFKIRHDLRKDSLIALSRIYMGDKQAVSDASRLMDQLRYRVHARLRSTALKMTSSAVAVLALPFILCGPVTVIGHAMVLTSAVMGLVTFLHDLRYFNSTPLRFTMPPVKVINTMKSE